MKLIQLLKKKTRYIKPDNSALLELTMSNEKPFVIHTTESIRYKYRFEFKTQEKAETWLDRQGFTLAPEEK